MEVPATITRYQTPLGPCMILIFHIGLYADAELLRISQP